MKSLLFLRALGFAAGIGAVCLLPFTLSSCDAKKDEEMVQILSTASSPDGKYVADVYVLMGGGAAGYVLHHVDLRYSVSKMNPERYIYWGRGSGNIAIEWAGNRHLVIHSPMETRFLASVYEDVQITLDRK